MLTQLKTAQANPLLFFISSIDEDNLEEARTEIRITLVLLRGRADETSHVNLIVPSGELLSIDVRFGHSEAPSAIKNCEKESARIIIENPFILWRDVGSRVFAEVFELTSLKLGKGVAAAEVGVSRQQIYKLCNRDRSVTQSIFQSLIFVTMRSKIA